ncbi:MAG: gluconolaconase [Gammaproteobacteria bacterium]|nr:gluconolaconase [Gammaproteobacteria bacterium]|tara:strand:+ start:233 stop:1153 length:921 start_codon:yes stop_codon:yes gene_type:complete
MTDFTEITSELRFPEGPIAMDDGSVILVEIARGTLSRVLPDGEVTVVCDMGGGPNGAAMGPDGHVYVCNNGGFEWIESSTGRLFPGDQAADYTSGRIERVNIETGTFETVYTECDGEPLKGPNDLVFDREGGFWFTDHGKNRPRNRDRTGVFYAKADGSHIEEVLFPLEAPNGIGLSPDEKTLYVAETPTGRLWAFDIESPGKLRREGRGNGGRMLAQIPDHHLFDSLAVDGEGNVCVATIITGGITVHSPDGNDVRLIPLPDPLTTNICFGGDDLRTAYATLSTTGRLISFPWQCPGLPLNFLNT